ncbi:hypothetical protein SNE40_011302 [Patella caerulea]|uniref:Solute carrier family 12 member 2 n=1 Tax=Patella caerulea TaxID=87958 RepID=A0AAN8PHX4_PATCE
MVVENSSETPPIPASIHDKRQRKQAIVISLPNEDDKFGTICEEEEGGNGSEDKVQESGIRIHITAPEDDSGVDTETGTPSPLQTEFDKDKEVRPARFHVHPVYEKRPQRFRKISSYSADSEHSAPSSNTVVPSRKGSTVMIHQQPEVIQGYDNYLSVNSNEGGYHYHNEHVASVPKQHRISVFSCYSQASRASFQSDRTFRDMQEALPSADHYRDAHGTFYDFNQRPTLYQLREKQDITKPGKGIGDDLKDDVEEGKTTPPADVAKMGWIQGVLIRCVLNIFGVMLFLRLTWITGQAGIGFASLIILLSSFVTAITTMSMSAICTNGEVKGGGAYYMISRSLGPEFGGAIGVVFSLANAVAAAMYVVGFAETVRDLLWENGIVLTGNQLHDVRIIGCILSVFILAVVLIGLDFEAKAQLVLLVILLAAIVNYFVGTVLPPTQDQKLKGFVGYSDELFKKNFQPDFRENNNFFSVFAIFFPAATGILAGANISGDLKNASKAIPKGTFLAIVLTSAIYLGMVWCIGSTMLRDAVGDLPVNGDNATDLLLTTDLISQCSNTTCDYGLINDNAAVGLASAFRPLILAGIFSATLSSALASMVSAPKVFQALGKDKLFPFIHYFAKGFGKSGEPKRGYFLTFGICIGVTCIGALDIIAPIISNFFLMAYALINFSCFDASFANTPGFRPAFKFYNKWISLMGSLLCVGVMFLINWWAALVSFVTILALYVYLKHRKPDVNWGSSSQAHAYKDALQTSLRLMNVEEHVKNFRPQILVLTGFPRNRPALVDFVSTITKRQSLLICGQIFMGDMYEHVNRLRSTAAYNWFKNRDIRAFYTSVVAPNLRYGSQVLLQSQGMGKLRPNTLILGYKNDWQLDDPRAVDCYFNVISDAFDLHYGVGILRVSEGLDVHKIPDEYLDKTDDTIENLINNDSSDEDAEDDDDEDEVDAASGKISDTQEPEGEGIVLQKFTKTDGGADNHTFQADDTSFENEKEGVDIKKDNPEMKLNGHELKITDFEKEQRKKYLNMKSFDEDKVCNRFKVKQEGTIDVWWLFDDGGLTLLIPYILSKRKQYKSCKLRVFCAGTKKENLEEDHRRMATLLSKFRIEFSSITVIPDLKRKPKRASYKEFEAMIYRWRLGPGESEYDYPWKISNTDLMTHKQKTYMQIKLREKLLEHSSEAALIVMTLPVPRKTTCPAGLYMAWLEMLTNNLPPTLLLRGNQQSVLTYFS